MISVSLCFNLRSHEHQSLKDHLEGVAEAALFEYDSQFDDPEMRKILRKVCLAHDFGKGTTFFQEFLDWIIKGKVEERQFGKEKNHALISALFAYWWLPEKYKMMGFLVIKRHHEDMNNVRDEFDISKDLPVLKKQIQNIKENTQSELERIYGFSLNEFFEFVTENNLLDMEDAFTDLFSSGFEINDNFELNYLYSLLLTGDKMQLVAETPEIPDHPNCKIVEDYKNHVRQEALAKDPAIAHSRIFQIRDDIFEEVKRELEIINLLENSFFSINIPTGSGKTFLAYYSSLYLAEKFKNVYGKRARIIYTLPFMSIIDQNCDELMNIIKYATGSEEEPKDNVVLKHHSLAEISYKTDKNELSGYDAKFCYDNWQSGIVVTTFVQLLNTMFKIGGKNISHRFNRLANSIIILDEVQAIDEKYYAAMREVFQVLARDYNVKFIFVTATMPAIVDSYELVKNQRCYFEQLNRVVIHNHIHEDLTLSDFAVLAASKITNKKDKSFLFVLNTIKSTKALFNYLRENTDRECVYLSTELYPKIRLEKIKYIKKSDKKLVVVSTPLMEAGVDIDQDEGHRDLAPQDSLNQFSGRVGRNGLGESREVHIYRLKDEQGRYYYNRIYASFAIEITRELLENRQCIQESEIYDINLEYARRIEEQTSRDKSESLFKSFKNLDVKTLRDSFQLIDNSEAYTRDIYIIGDDECRDILRELQAIKNTFGDKWENRVKIQNLFRRLNLYRVSLYMNAYSMVQGDLINIAAFDLECLPLKVENREIYSADLGIIYENLSIFNTGEEE